MLCIKARGISTLNIILREFPKQHDQKDSFPLCFHVNGFNNERSSLNRKKRIVKIKKDE